MKRTNNKKRLTLDILILITTEEKLISIENAKIPELIGIGVAITDASLDRERKDEEEIATAITHYFHHPYDR
jgi:hypothetical protein